LLIFAAFADYAITPLFAYADFRRYDIAAISIFRLLLIMPYIADEF